MRINIILDKCLKIFVILTIIASVISFSSPKTSAATVTINCPDSAQAGTPITISVSGSAAQWHLTLKVNGTIIAEDNNVNNVGGNLPISFSGTYTPQEKGTLNVTLEGDITEASDDSVTKSFPSKTITVNDPPVEQNQGGDNQTEEPPVDNNEGGNGNGNGGGTTPQVPVETPQPQTTDPEPKSTNNNLSSLTVSAGTLTPSFNRAREEYTIEFPEDFDYKSLETITVTAKAEHNKAKVGGAGNIKVSEGENIIEIDVTPEAGTPIKTYRITFVKPEIIEQSDLRLKNLTINTVDEDGKTKEAELNPKFSAEVFNYTLDVDPTIERLEVKDEVENDKIVVDISGADKLHSGKNLVKITLTSPTDENVKSVYQITVNKERELIEEAGTNTGLDESSKTKLIMGIIIVVIVILAVVLITLIVINNKKNKQERAGEEDDEDYDKFNKKADPENLEKKKASLFNYEDEDTYLNDEKLEKISDEYLETAKKMELEEKEKNDKFDKVASIMEGKKYIEDDDEVEEENKTEDEENEKNEENEENNIENSDAENSEDYYEKNDELRKAKLDELEKEIKQKRNSQVEKEDKPFNKDEFLNEIKNKRGKNL